ncbi:4-hydroxybenzoate polyprenyltransferase, partial [Streptomyces sp. SID11233]|nr:4-hydroxybenzoate polyprenyltransferase [Streptomyces sp. SID11233]
FDLIFACQDVAADRAHGVKSVPARFGIPAALWGARASAVVTTGLLVWFALLTDAGVLFWLGLLIVAIA